MGRVDWQQPIGDMKMVKAQGMGWLVTCSDFWLLSSVFKCEQKQISNLWREARTTG